jgi:hypothetical protein
MATTLNKQLLEPKDLPLVIRLAGLWIIWVVWSQIAGWTLSAAGALHATGYILQLPLLLISSWLLWKKTSPTFHRPYNIRKSLRRVKSTPVILAWCVISLLILIGAIAHAPTNYDGVTYRLPRLLLWLQENNWHWIDGLDHRQNVSALGHEWMIAPLIAITRSDRALFLINFLPFLLLPGLFFVAARGLGIRLRVAKWWMWIWPMAYGIALQAGSIANDLMPASLSLSAIAFISQAKRSHSILCLGLAIMATAAMTGSKATSIPLVLPIGIYWLHIAWNTLRLKEILFTVGLLAPLAIPASFVPLTIACLHYTGHWSGNPNNRYGAEAENPLAGIIGNSVEIVDGALQIPIHPGASSFNRSLNESFEKQDWHTFINKGYPLFKSKRSGEIPIEEMSGIGIGITALIICTIVLRFLRRERDALPISYLQIIMLVATAISLVAFMSKMGTGGTARLSLPYIPLIILCALFGLSCEKLKNKLSNYMISLLPSLCLLPGLILNPNRPLLPIDFLTNHSAVSKAFKNRLNQVYGGYRNRAAILSPLLNGIPTHEVIGFAGGGDHSALGLFKPYGSRTVLQLTPSTEANVDWVIGIKEPLEERMQMNLSEWESRGLFLKNGQMEIISYARRGPEPWLIYRRNIPKP